MPRPALATAVVIGLGLALAAAAGADPVQEARTAVGLLLQSVVGTAHDDALSPDARRALVERELEDHLDLNALTAAALGPLAAGFTPEQLVDFSREYQRHLLTFLLRHVAASDAKGPQLGEAALDPQTGVVTVRALGRSRPPLSAGRVAAPREASRPVPWDFGLRQRRGRWQIVSLRINAVDVSQNFRAQLAAVLQRSDPDALITELRTRNLADEAANPFEEK
jgi:ABC-type transporter MlaC component